MKKKSLSDERLSEIDSILTELISVSFALGIPRAYVDHVQDIRNKTIPAIKKAQGRNNK